MIRRRAVRAVLFDSQDRLLLVRCQDPKDPTCGFWWTTVGGGLEAGESDETALRREVAEEVGISEFEVGSLLWQDRVNFRFLNEDFEQENDYYLARTKVTDIDTSMVEEIERLSNIEHRWWPLTELKESSEVIYPIGLADLVVQLLHEGPPEEPLVLTW